MRIFPMLALLCGGLAGLAQAAPSSPAEVEQALKQRFFDAARAGDVPVLREFIVAGYPLDLRAEKGYTALILAAYHGHAEAVQALMAGGADPCAKDDRGNLALTGAIFKGELAIAHTLLGAKCQVDQRNKAGQTPAMYAALFHRTDILAALRDKGADMEAKDTAGNTPNSLGAAQ
ncbi:MAG: ankyrin repeat domain-containing protein [Pseudomonadota bacterium]